MVDCSGGEQPVPTEPVSGAGKTGTGQRPLTRCLSACNPTPESRLQRVGAQGLGPALRALVQQVWGATQTQVFYKLLGTQVAAPRASLF